MKQEINYKNEELLNSISHGLGILLGIFGLVVLLLFDTAKSPYSTLSILFYGVSIIILYTASTVYHAVTHIKWKTILRKIDHISIYLLIAGTYTPVALIALEKGSGWVIFWTIWGIAFVGTLLKIFFTGRFEILSLALYLVMGWLIVFNIRELIENTTQLGMNLMMLGGAFYTLGIIFYAIRKIPYNHFIWHIFVLGGSISHFLFILLDVI
ncbi:MAG: hemolysin III family protein [Cytophagaceae bacterium]|nr:hemolysin III family protein [Cytophagaceae bacterium]